MSIALTQILHSPVRDGSMPQERHKISVKKSLLGQDAIMPMCHRVSASADGQYSSVKEPPTLPFAYGLVTVKGGIRGAEGQSPPA